VVPLRLNDSHAAIVGDLWSVAPPALWFWLAIPIAIVIAAITLLRFGRTAVVRRSTPLVAAITAVAIVVARTGRDLYGRPEVTTGRYVSIGLGIALAVLALERLLRGREGVKLIVAMIAGVLGVVQGLTMLPALWHGLVLATIPAEIERLCIGIALGGGLTTLIFTFADTKTEVDEPQPLAS
jgi:hypothetical protein